MQLWSELPPHQRIVAAARDLFCRDGIHATGIDRILAAAHASKMTLYARFGSKDALLREVLEQEGAEWRASFFAAVDAGPRPPHPVRSDPTHRRERPEVPPLGHDDVGRKWERHPKVPFLLLGFPEPRMVTPRGEPHPCQRCRWHL